MNRKTQKLKLLLSSKTQMVTKLNSPNYEGKKLDCDKTKNLGCEKTKKNNKTRSNLNL